MESPRMYEEGEPDISFKKDLLKQVFTFTEESQHALTLDPTLENVVDLQELINTAIPTLEAEEGPLNLDSIFPASDLDIVEGHTSNFQAGNQNNFLDISKFVPETVQKICMTNSKEASFNTTGSDCRQILTIKSEDLDLTACQSPEVTVCAADSYTSENSSRCSTPNTPKTPIVYECRKPGRKPSAGGPIRPRKKEPKKDTAEYYEKRARNNVAVRKSREKAKLRQGVTETRVQELTSENERLQKKVDLLSKELNVLKSLFINVGASLPENFEEILSR
ncbi:CCAAT/enhancer-binding protein-like [Mercenaria mercenaria]|uniref:CCAAT/enhancer-binding protein-like n=1 Tax=Mercenaria mercenaria TaxID=6596 RepID=UPI00234E9F79|nr:CCAAT/enhancer-binding protein-like [Mercenaria mercenaria]